MDFGSNVEVLPPTPDAWVDRLERMGDSVDLSAIEQALHNVGAHPLSTRIWLRRLELSSSESAEDTQRLFHRALSVPQYAAADIFKLYVQSCKVVNSSTVNEYENSSRQLASEDWPTLLPPNAATSQQSAQWTRWATLLQVLFRQLVSSNDWSPQGSVPLQRIDLVFRQARFEQPSHEGLRMEYILFRRLFFMDHNNNEPIGAAAGDRRLALLLQQRHYLSTLPEAKKAFREIGKNAEREKMIDWRLYHHWAMLESQCIHDTKMAAKVYERGIAVAKDDVLEHDVLAAKAQRFFLSRHAEGEFMSLMEKRVQYSSKCGEENFRRSVVRQLHHGERCLGVVGLRAIEDDEEEGSAASAAQRLSSFYRVGPLQPMRSWECAGLSTLLRTDPAAPDRQTADVSEAQKRLNLKQIPRASSVVGPGLVSSYQLFTVPLMQQPQMALPSQESELDDVVGPRVLRGTVAQKLHFDDSLLARLTEETNHKKRARGVDESTTSSSAASLSRYLDQLPSQLQVVVRSLEAAAPCAVNSHWLIHQLAARELNLNQLLR